MAKLGVASGTIDSVLNSHSLGVDEYPENLLKGTVEFQVLNSHQSFQILIIVFVSRRRAQLQRRHF